MDRLSDPDNAHGRTAISDLIAREIVRAQVAPGDVDRAVRFLASARRDPKAYQALPRRMRRLVDRLIAA